MAKKKPSEDRFVQPTDAIRMIKEDESFRDLPLKKQRERMRVMYRDLKPEESK